MRPGSDTERERLYKILDRNRVKCGHYLAAIAERERLYKILDRNRVKCEHYLAAISKAKAKNAKRS
jgi:hypothetical protein